MVNMREKTTQLPTKIPAGKEQLERVIMLLGSRGKSELKVKAREELIHLIGAYPSVEQAAIWKSNLKKQIALIKESLVKD